MLILKLSQKLTVFSDGSLFFEVISSDKKVKKLDKDLKFFQKSFKEKALNNLSKTNNTNIYRKKHF